VLHAHDGRRPVVIACDPAARAMGIRTGMPLAQARMLAPDLHAEPAAVEADDAALEHLAAWCLWLSPLTSARPPDEIWIDTAGCDHLHGGEEAMLAALGDRMRDLGYRHRLALADTAGAAYALTRSARIEAPVIIPPHAQKAALNDLPVAGLRLSADCVSGLNRLGLTTIGALCRAPRAPLVRRFGPELMRRLDQALGHVAEPLLPQTSLDAIIARRSFVEPIGTDTAIAAVIDVLVPEICEILIQRGLGARLLDLLCTRVDDTVQAVRIGTASPVREAFHLARLLKEQIETIAPGFGIEAMQLVVARSETLENNLQGQASLGERTRDADLSCLIDRLRNSVGPENVLRLAPWPSDWPEHSQTEIPVDARFPALPWAACGRRQALPRPVRLTTPPDPIQVVALLPDGAPRLFLWRGHRHIVRGADGPERLHGEWWRDRAVYGAIRDYWIVETEDDERFWLFRRGDGVHDWSGDRSWFLHGLF